jgi:cell division protease FtsH
VRDLVTKYGMSEELGPIQFGNQHENPFLGRSMMEDRNYSDAIAFRIDEEVKKIVTTAYDKAKDVLAEQRLKMDYIAELLIDKEYLERDEFEQLMREPVPEGWQPKPPGPGVISELPEDKLPEPLTETLSPSKLPPDGRPPRIQPQPGLTMQADRPE